MMASLYTFEELLCFNVKDIENAKISIGINGMLFPVLEKLNITSFTDVKINIQWKLSYKLKSLMFIKLIKMNSISKLAKMELVMYIELLATNVALLYDGTFRHI